jgi:hypothetical protein
MDKSKMKCNCIDLKTMLEVLKDNIFKKQDEVSEGMHAFFGGKIKYIVFLSASDVDSRAYVCKGIGNTIESSWKNATDSIKKRMNDRNVNPVWLKADVVYEIKEYSYQVFLDYVSRIKTNYFREGISFDALFQVAFMEQEVNANVFIADREDSAGKELKWKNINYYLRNTLGVKGVNLNERTTTKIYTFKTLSAFHDGQHCYNLESGCLNNGRRHVQQLNEEYIRFIIKQSSSYLARQVNQSGKFRYGYFPCFDKEVPTYNILRHASSTYSMIEAYEVEADEQLQHSIQLALEYLLREGIEFLNDPNGKVRAFVIERAADNEIKLGANAAAILAMAKYTSVFGDTRYVEVIQALAEGIEYFQNPETGSYSHILNYPDLSIKEKHRVIYYDGEATFALMRLYELDKNQRWLQLVEKAFEYFIENRYWRYHDHWLSYCSNELFKHKAVRKYVDFNLKNASLILDFCLTRETTYPTLLELLMATYNMISKMKQENCFIEALDSFDYEKFMKALEYRAEHQLNGWFFPEVAMYYKAPNKILWAFYIRHHSFRSRIDDNEHNISGYCSYLNNVIVC